MDLFLIFHKFRQIIHKLAVAQAFQLQRSKILFADIISTGMHIVQILTVGGLVTINAMCASKNTSALTKY